MIVHAWRIVKAKHAGSAFTGEGAKSAGGRWNSPGRAIVYAAGSQSLAILEMLVHLQSQELLQRYVLFDIAFDSSLQRRLEVKSLPKNWKKSPSPGAVQAMGDEWIANAGAVVLRVPSVLVPSEWNYLINPQHPDFKRLAIGPKQRIKFDSRLLRN